MAAAAYAKERKECIQKNRRCCGNSNEVAQSWGERRGNHVRYDWIASSDKRTLVLCEWPITIIYTGR